MTQPRLAVPKQDGRYYKVPGIEEPLPSVTTILGALAKPALAPWAAKSVAEWVRDNWQAVHAMMQTDPDAAVQAMKGAPWRQSNKAADLGSAIHAVADALASGAELPEIPPEAEPYIEQFLAAHREHDIEMVATERTVCNTYMGYAGTMDALIRIDGRLLVCDIKTGKDVWPEAVLQLAAYQHASYWVTDEDELEEMPRVDGAVVLHLRPDRHRLIEVTDEHAWVAFGALMTVWRWQQTRRGAL
jgi:hypothetical protein